MKSFYSIIIYVLLTGVLVPDFSAYDFYFYIDVIEMDNFYFSMLTVLQYIGIIIGARFYKQVLVNCETRNLKIAFSAAIILISTLRVLMATRTNEHYVGMPDWYIIVLT